MKIAGGKNAVNEVKIKQFTDQRKKKLYSKGKMRIDRSQDDIKYEKERGEYTFQPFTHLKSAASLHTSKAKQAPVKLPTALSVIGPLTSMSSAKQVSFKKSVSPQQAVNQILKASTENTSEHNTDINNQSTKPS